MDGVPITEGRGRGQWQWARVQSVVVENRGRSQCAVSARQDAHTTGVGAVGQHEGARGGKTRDERVLKHCCHLDNEGVRGGNAGDERALSTATCGWRPKNKLR